MAAAVSRSIVQSLKDFLFPPLCLSCRGRLCSADDHLCARCARSLARVEAADYTMAVLNSRYADSAVISSFYPLYYFEEDGVLQHVIHALKYEEMTALGERYGEAIGAALLAVPAYAGVSVIIPVPLHARKERERGYNQSACICTGIARVMRLPVASDVVFRQKNTRTQTKLSAAARLKNVRDAFAADPRGAKKIRGATVLLVDDVITTGATIHACARTLRAAGAGEIVCASIGIAKLHAGG